MTSQSAYPWTADTQRLRNWLIAYLIVWIVGLYATFSSFSHDLTPGFYVLLLCILPYIGCVVYAYRVQNQLNVSGLYRPGAWQVIVGAVILNPLVFGFLIPASVLWTARGITRRAPTIAPPGSPTPYRTPQAQLPPVADVAAATAAGHTRARWTIGLLYTGLALDGLAIISDFLQRGLLSRIAAGEQFPEAVLLSNDSRQGLIGGAQVLVFVVTAIVWLVWLHRAYANLGAVGVRKAKFTTGWAVGYWFVPFVNLVRPYQIVVDLWQRSDRLNAEASVEHLPGPPVIAWWWGVYLLSGFAGRVFANVSGAAHTVQDLINATDVGVVVDVIGIISALLAIAVVRGIDERQRRFASQRTTMASVP